MVRYIKSDRPTLFASLSPTSEVLEQKNPKYKRQKHEGEADTCKQLECPRMEGDCTSNATCSLIYLDQTTLKESLDKKQTASAQPGLGETWQSYLQLRRCQAEMQG